jgi:hypothetical protein
MVEKVVLREIVEVNDEKARTFQVMLLRNDASRQVEIHESREVNYSIIQEHLQRGGSVFITSKPSQKITLPTFPERKACQKRRAVRTVTAFYFDHV